jgi:outer membrane protein TolC
MARVRAAAALAAVSLVLLRAPAASATTYTLAELVSRVRASSPAIAAARAGVDAAKAQVGQARLSWAPFGDLYMRLQPTPTVRNGDYESGRLDPKGLGFTTTYVDWLRTGSGGALAAQPFQGVFFSFQMSLIQPIYTFGKIESSTKAARAGVTYAEGQAAAAAADVELEAMRAYWLVKCERAARDVMEDIVARLGEWVAAFQSDLEGKNQGNYSEADLARLKAALESARLVHFENERQVANGLATIRALTLDPTADVDDAAVAVAEDGGRTLAWYEDATRTHRPEMKLIEGGRQAMRFMRKWRLADMFPSFVLVLGVQYNYTTNQDNPLTLGLAGPTFPYPYPAPGPVQMHWDLDLAVRYGRLQQAIATERATEEQVRWAIGGIRVELRKAWADHEEARKRALQLGHAERVARGWYGIVQGNMAAGITVASDARELVDALRTYFDFRLRHLLAIMDANLTLAQLHRASGVQ